MLRQSAIAVRIGMGALMIGAGLGCSAANNGPGGGSQTTGTGMLPGGATGNQTRTTATGAGTGSGAGNLPKPAMTASASGSAGASAPMMSGAAGMGSSAMGMAGMGSFATGSAGSSGGAAGSGMMTGSAGASAPMHADLGSGDGRDVITIGDSWMNLIVTGIEPSLDKVAGKTYRHYAVPGTLVLNEQIPNQYESAKMENKDIKTIVMTGGGNDILTSSCADTACDSIVDMVAMRLTKLLAEMGTDGVEDVVLIGYTYPSDMSKHEALDHSRTVSQMTCTPDGMPRCHFLDSSMLQLTLQDGIHPNAAGCDLIALTVWQQMQSEGMRR